MTNQKSKIKNNFRRASQMSILIVFIFLISLPYASFAQVSLSDTLRSGSAPAAGFQYPWSGAKDPAGLIAKIYQYGLALAAISAFGMIVYGGILYVISGVNPSRQKDAKDHIMDAIWGLLLLLAAYVILYTINPQLVRIGETQSFLDSLVKPATIAPSETLSGYSHDQAASYLNDKGIRVLSTRGCYGRNEKGCTDLTGMNKACVDKLVNIKKLAGVDDGNFVLNGANETAGHAIEVLNTTHGNGCTFDVSIRFGDADKQIRNYASANNIKVEDTDLGRRYTLKDGSILLRESNHWHIRFEPAGDL